MGIIILQIMLPKFKYHPNLYQSNVVVFEKGICQCCEKEVTAYIDLMYFTADADCIYLDCVASGKAADKPKNISDKF